MLTTRRAVVPSASRTAVLMVAAGNVSVTTWYPVETLDC